MSKIKEKFLSLIDSVAAALLWFRSWILGLRKYSFSLLLLGVSTYLVSVGIITGENFADIHIVLAPAFMATNLLEHGMEVLKNRGNNND